VTAKPICVSPVLNRSARATSNELECLDADLMPSENLDVLVHSLLTWHTPEPVSVDWTAASGTPVQETTIERTVRGFEEQRDLPRVSVPPGRIRA
jgi:hypothetical protein